jgi:hypothetical protein
MTQLAPLPSRSFPALIATAGDRAQLRFLEFFASNLRSNSRPKFALRKWIRHSLPKSRER